MNSYIKVYFQLLETVDAYTMLDIDLRAVLISQNVFHVLIANYCILGHYFL